MKKSGALAFLESKTKDFTLFEVRDHPLPSKAVLSYQPERDLMECMKEVQPLCNALDRRSLEEPSIRNLANPVLRLISGQSMRESHMLDYDELLGWKTRGALEGLYQVRG